MKTYRIVLTFLNPYIGQRNGGNRKISEGLSLATAQKELLDLFNERFEGYASTWDEAKELTKERIFSAGGSGAESYFEWDSRRFAIVINRI